MLKQAFALLLIGFGLLHGEAPAPRLKGELRLVGSDSMDPLVLLWFEAFQKHHPDAELRAVSKGSATAPLALAEGRAGVGHMSRPMNAAEEALFERAKGYKPTQVVVAHDALAVWVNQANPVKYLTIEQLDAIYSSTRKAGWEEPVVEWGDLGLGGVWRRRAVVPYGRDELSGTRAFFEEKALLKGVAHDRIRVAGDQWAVVEAPGKEAGGISYGPVSYAGSGVRAVPLVALHSGRAHLPTKETILNGKYPLARVLSLYVDKVPGRPLPELTRAFLGFVLSKEGQALVASYGAIPIETGRLDAQRARLELDAVEPR